MISQLGLIIMLIGIIMMVIGITYSLCSKEKDKEIERLKELLNELYLDYAVCANKPGTDVNQMWLEYQKKHNL